MCYPNGHGNKLLLPEPATVTKNIEKVVVEQGVLNNPSKKTSYYMETKTKNETGVI